MVEGPASLFCSLLPGNWPETGSLETAPTASFKSRPLEGGFLFSVAIQRRDEGDLEEALAVAIEPRTARWAWRPREPAGAPYLGASSPYEAAVTARITGTRRRIDSVFFSFMRIFPCCRYV